MQPRRLLLVRHAKAADGIVDADRPLTRRGEERAAAIGAWLEQAGAVPDLVVVSPARRAAQTWELASAPLTSGRPPVVDARIYDNTVESLLEVIREAPDDVRTVAVVGHNPSIGELAAALDDGQGSPEAQDALDAGFPTGGVAVFVLPTSFAELEPGAATLSAFTVPGN
jgi:phosphohistidine phosphatase